MRVKKEEEAMVELHFSLIQEHGGVKIKTVSYIPQKILRLTTNFTGK